MTAFEEFPKIPRLFRECVITEKIDGTNAQILIPEDGGPLLAGSRNRWLEPTKTGDNFGFATWVKEHEDELRAGLGIGRHYGEWWGAGVQRRYGLSEKRFSLFNTGRWTKNIAEVGTPLLPSSDPRAPGKPRELAPSCCSVVPLMHVGAFTDHAVQFALGTLEETGSEAAPGFMQPEGIVIWHEAARQLFKVTLGGDGHKEARVRK